MMFQNLSDKLASISERIKGKQRITEADLKEMQREIRLALLEADVNYQVVKEFNADIKERCMGAEVMKSLTPGQQVVKIVHEELIKILGSDQAKLEFSPSGFTVIMLYGLQGTGKTTTAAKLGVHLRKLGKKPLLASVDVHRPAAQEQLKVLAKQADLAYYINPQEPRAEVIAAEAIDRARYLLCDVLIVDTAGRMTVDPELMEELKRINAVVNPTERLLVLDAMIGQEAVNIAEAFNNEIGVDGYIMTKLDGDARGGAALSIRKVTGKPIKMIGVGEKISEFEAFHPDRMASRILGMGDVLSLIEKASQSLDEEKAQEAYDKLRRNRFDLNDLMEQIVQMQKMGPLKEVLSFLPGAKQLKDVDIDDKLVDRQLALLRSMTEQERRNPKLLDASRRKRIARGSGQDVAAVNRLLKQYTEMQKMMKKFKRMSKGQKRQMARMFGADDLPF
ncbi:MAG: signal recognition particle protein [Eubacteriales bacterium]|nr:signal recognition particle protein [Eubacteriales bacterium]